MKHYNGLSIVTALLLRITVIVFVFSFLYEVLRDLNNGEMPQTGFIDVLLVAAFLIISIVLMILDKPKFELIGFLIVFTISTFRLLSVLFQFGLRTDMSLHLMLMGFSFYFMAKPFTHKRKRGASFLE